MADELTLQIVVREPLPEVFLRMQRGRHELVAPVRVSALSVTFELRVQAVMRANGAIVLKGPEVQGPPAQRFVYVNAGSYAGAPQSPWSRRAKVPLGAITEALVHAVQATTRAVLRAEIHGRARDGGPAAATVPLLGAGWTVASGEE
ncbi:DUF5990 family protein [Gemmatimonas groenlandica]|uniref:Uncharacterized protein n=1 Tax=Gemmatimonas groenlandica TaxID=2732249 RepID=A0A6M4IS83_9BACT|nr:DUF5990 family protein [Gemmatimonas groenlandica]QJR37603.1 hypothetical protein HKW67_19820 [Gemmatimonas groenlandica]